MAGRHFMFRQGTRGSAVLLGLYGYTGSGSPVLLGDTYDRRNGKVGSYVPPQYNRNVRHQAFPANDYVPLFSVSRLGSPPVDGPYAFYFRQAPFDSFGNPTPTVPTARWLFTSDGTSAPTAVATNAGIQSADLFGLLSTPIGFYALAGGATPRVWSSANGALWTQGSFLTGALGVPIQTGTTSKMFEFGGDFYTFTFNGLFRNAGNDGVDWAAVPLLDGAIYSTRYYYDVAWDGTAIVVICQGVKITDGLLYNIILRSTDGTTFAEVRNELQSTDVVPATAVPLEWQQVVAFGTGFCAYGAHTPSGAFPNVLKSTDHGATWAAVAKVNPLENNAGQLALANVTGYADANRVVASRNLETGLPEQPFYPRLHESADGITFTQLSF